MHLWIDRIFLFGYDFERFASGTETNSKMKFALSTSERQSHTLTKIKQRDWENQRISHGHIETAWNPSKHNTPALVRSCKVLCKLFITKSEERIVVYRTKMEILSVPINTDTGKTQRMQHKQITFYTLRRNFILWMQTLRIWCQRNQSVFAPMFIVNELQWMIYHVERNHPIENPNYIFIKHDNTIKIIHKKYYWKQNEQVNKINRRRQYDKVTIITKWDNKVLFNPNESNPSKKEKQSIYEHDLTVLFSAFESSESKCSLINFPIEFHFMIISCNRQNNIHTKQLKRMRKTFWHRTEFTDFFCSTITKVVKIYVFNIWKETKIQLNDKQKWIKMLSKLLTF